VTDRRRWFGAVVLGLALVGLIVRLVAPTIVRQHQYSVLRSRGVTTTARLTYCSSTTSGRAGTTTVTWPATLALGGTEDAEDILGLASPLTEGTTLRVVVDPRNVSTVYPLTDVRTEYHSGWLTTDTAVAVVALALLALTVASQVIVVRRRRRTTGPAGRR
jgi:hypothetical protein